MSYHDLVLQIFGSPAYLYWAPVRFGSVANVAITTVEITTVAMEPALKIGLALTIWDVTIRMDLSAACLSVTVREPCHFSAASSAFVELVSALVDI